MNKTERDAKNRYEAYRKGLFDRRKTHDLGVLKAGIEDDECGTNHTPTPEEIAEACEAFRAGWSEATRARRSGLPTCDTIRVYTISIGRSGIEFAASELCADTSASAGNDGS